jgi:hypothetical protein
MARGAVAKDKVTETIAKAFGGDFVGVQDKKIYVWADDGGTRIQVAISLTCPKTELGAASSDDGIDFDNFGAESPMSAFKPAELTQAEMDNVKQLMTNLHLY